MRSPRHPRRALREGRPSPQRTPQILDLLRRYNAKATFFTVGSQVSAHPALLRRIAAAGHAIGNHTYHHAELTRISAAGFAAEVSATPAAITRIAAPRLPPLSSGTSTRRTGAGRARRRRLGSDGSRAAGAIVPMHNGGGDRSETVAALSEILRTLTARGYTFRALE